MLKAFFLMSIVKRHIKSLEVLKGNVSKIAEKAVIDNIETILNILKFSQLGLGFRSDGQRLSWTTKKGKKRSGFYAPSTQDFADDPHNTPIKPKIANEPYNFQWTGSFFNFMDLKLETGNKYSIFSSDGKAALIRRTYGEVLQFTKENNHIINTKIIEPELVKYVSDNWWRFRT